MTGEEPRLQALTRIPYFADLDAAVLKDVSRAVIRRRCEADEVVVLEGEPCSGLGIVRTGRLKTVKLSTAGREQILSILEPGDIFSAVSVFADAPNPATVVALKPSTLWIIPRDRLLTLQNRYPELTQGIIRGLTDRVLHLVTLIEDLSLRTVEMRLARQLLDHADGDLIEREPWATQAEMSARLGTVTYVLNRVLRGFEDEGLIVQYIFPALSDIGVIAGVVWALAAYGFAARRNWAWTLAVVANVMALQSSFFPMIPPVTRDLPPATALIFVPNLLFYLLLLTLVRPVSARTLIIGLLSGIAMVLSFMNGVASTNKMIVEGAAIFTAVQRLNWVAALGWGIFTVGILVKPAAWVRWLGLGAGLLELTAGLPLGIKTAAATGRFSMFLPAPLLSLALLILLLLPVGRRLPERQKGRASEPAPA